MTWKSVMGYDGLYEVSYAGDIRSVDRYINTDIRHVSSRLIKGKVLTQNTKRNGYKTVDLCKNGKVTTTLVHRLVAEAFLPNPNGLRLVNHKGSDRANNSADNLEWVTSSENRAHGMTQGFVSFTHARQILCKDTGMVFERVAKAVEWVTANYPERVNVSARIAAQYIGRNCHGTARSAFGFTWKYLEGSTTIP